MKSLLLLILCLPAQEHKFLDWKNAALLAGSATAITADSLSTQKCLGHSWCKEINPLARPFVQTRKGQAFVSGAAFGAEIAGVYLAHRRGWHRVERIIQVTVIAGEALVSRHNYQLHMQ